MLAVQHSLPAISLLTLILTVGIGVQWIAARLRLPALILLLAAGLVLGPMTGVLEPRALFGDLLQPLISLSVAVVLFDGGLSLRFDEARRAGRVLWRLIVTGLVLGFVLVTAFASTLIGLSMATSAVLGAILVVTGPTVILPMLRDARLAPRPATLLKWEGIVNDPLGALLAVVVFQVFLVDDSETMSVLQLFGALLVRTVLAGLVGGVIGWLLGVALRRDWLSEHLASSAMLAGVFLAYTAGEAIGSEAGLLAVTVMGLVLANVEEPRITEIRHFKEQISVLLVSFLFIVLSAHIEPRAIADMFGPPLLLVAAVVLVVRPIVAAVATFGTGLPWRERVLIAWVAPRGVVAAAVAGAFEERLAAAGAPDAHLLVPVIFGVILVTVVAQGFTLRTLSRKLGLAARDGKGVLIVGAVMWSTELAKALQRAGAEVLLVDARYNRVSRARRLGLDAWFGDVLSEDAAVELPLERMTWLLAATDDDAYNSLVCTSFARAMGSKHVLQVTPDPANSGQDARAHALRGRAPWRETGTYRRLASAFWRADQFRVTPITKEYAWEQFTREHPDALLLFWVGADRLGPIEPGTEVPAGTKVVWIESGEPAPE